ncbi:MAG: endonuclease/exonuclease/phosphatase family protein [Schleiferiaceae bacterium]|nr:endonuclease/exonuclease/phosphatase family protein [Schleiferiaceae bacterium]
MIVALLGASPLSAQEHYAANPFISGAVLPYAAPVADSIVIVSWNVEHFTDYNDNPYINHRFEDSSMVSQEKLLLFAQALERLDADVVILQEFESLAFAKYLSEKYFSALGYRFFSSSESPDWYMNIVIMSRIPLGVSHGYGSVYTTSTYWRDSSWTDYTQAHLNNRIHTTSLFPTPDFEIILTGVHLKAGRYARDTAVRMSQIDMVRGHHEKLIANNKKAGILWVGDFNAPPLSKEIALAKKGKKRTRLIDGIAPDVCSHPADAPRWRLDYMLYNKEIAKRKNLSDSSVEVPLPNEQMRVISDHLPLRLQLYVK